MMRIGIISEFTTNTVNYGNHLQAYALNTFLQNHCSKEYVESVQLGRKQIRKYTGLLSYRFYQKVVAVILRRFRTRNSATKNCTTFFAERQKAFRRFRNEKMLIS